VQSISCQDKPSIAKFGNLWKERGDPVLHIDLRKWADILVVAPLDANSLAKIAQVSYSASNYYAFKSN
jgi:phosphopantothenoylcysteine synthetase/decarboxylase